MGGGGKKTKPYSIVCLASLVSQTIKNLPAVQETWVQSLDWEDPLEKEMATHFSIFTWKIPWTEEPGRLQSMGSQWVGHHWATKCTHTLIQFSHSVVSDSLRSQHQGLFQWDSSSHQVPRVLEFQLQHQSFSEYSGPISFWMDWLDLPTVQGTLKSLLQHHSSKASILRC